MLCAPRSHQNATLSGSANAMPSGAIGSRVIGANGSRGRFMRSVSTSGSSTPRDRNDRVGNSVLPCSGQQGPARVVARLVRFGRVVERDLRERERLLVDRGALVLHVRTAVRRAQVAAVQVQRDVEEHQVEHHRRTRREIGVRCELDECEERRDVLLVVDVRVPLGEPEAHLLVEPGADARVGRVARDRRRAGRRSRTSRRGTRGRRGIRRRGR